LSEEDRQRLLDSVRYGTSLEDLRDCELVIESAVEDLAIKNALLADIERHLSPTAILATNTSSLPLDALASGLARPERFVALHFFNPVSRMPLVEVGRAAKTDDDVVESVAQFAEQLEKVPVRVAGTPGYIVNRLLVPALLQAIETLELGIARPEEIDEAMRLGCGHPMGPLALADFIGLDVVLAMARTLQRELRDARYRAPSLLRRLVFAGHLGKKTGRGVYDYRGDTPVANDAIDLTSPMVAAATR
jgi:3-hydroxybutyryl-CoA dehydrogenase